MATNALSYSDAAKFYPPADRGRFSLARYAVFGRGYSAPINTPEIIDLGLRAGVKVQWGSKSEKPLPEDLLNAVEAIKQMEQNHIGWDSYDGLKLNDTAVLPAMMLVIEGVNRCRGPNVLPLPNGGIGLRWFNDAVELEIDIGPNAEGSALLENLATGETEEQDDATSAQLIQFVHRYCELAT